SAIVIADEASTLTLRRAEEQWVVVNRKGYPADPDRIENFVKSFTEMKALRELSAGAEQLDRIGLKQGTRVTLQDDKGNAIHTLTLGKELNAPGSDSQQSAMGRGGFPDRRFVMVDGERSSITVVDQTFSNATTGPADWLDKTFFQIEKPNAIEVIYNGTDSTNSWKLAKASDIADWKLDGELPEGKELDTAQAPTSALSNPAFNDLANDAEKVALDKNATQIKINTSEGFEYALKVGDSTDGSDKIVSVAITANFPEKRTPAENESAEDKKKLDEEWVAAQKTLQDKLANEQKFTQHAYRVSSYTVDAILKKRSELIKDEEKGAITPPPGGNLPIPFQNLPPQ
ncbi:MAG: DUF4340 domain-containing protein, partial [Pedosphaera sp.]|nr:DUF4340 domain-containing protein [Pedosphaera sp.]